MHNALKFVVWVLGWLLLKFKFFLLHHVFFKRRAFGFAKNIELVRVIAMTKNAFSLEPLLWLSERGVGKTIQSVQIKGEL